MSHAAGASRCARFFAPLLLLFLPSVAVPCWAETWYVSNRLGMKLEEVPRFRADEFAYVLRESTTNGVSVLTLYSAGKSSDGASPAAKNALGAPAPGLEGPPLGSEEVTRWERTPVSGGVEERELKGGVLQSVSLFGADGKLLRESVYVDGSVAEVRSYRYSGGLVSSVDAVSPTGAELWTIDYRLSPDGHLREMRRTGIEPETGAFSFSSGRLEEETLQSSGHTVVLRYDSAGRQVVWEVLSGSALLRAAYSSYDPASGNLKSLVDREGAQDRTDSSYDEQGRAVRQSVYRADKLIATLDYTYDAQGRKLSAQRRSDEGIESWLYRYAPDGTLQSEEYRERGSLRSRVVYGSSSSRYEEVIQSDRSTLRVYYEGDRKVKEEYLRDGKVVRSRVFGEADR